MRTASRMRWCQQQQPGAAIWVDKRSQTNTQAISVSKRFITETKANPRTDLCIARQTCLSLPPGRLPQQRVFFFLFSSSFFFLLLLLLLLLVFTSALLCGFIVHQFPEQSFFPFSIFPAPALPSCIYDACTTYMYTLTPPPPPFSSSSSSSLSGPLQHIFQRSPPPFDPSTWPHLKPPFRFLIGNGEMTVLSNIASSLTLLSFATWYHLRQWNSTELGFSVFEVGCYISTLHTRKRFRLFCNHI